MGACFHIAGVYCDNCRTGMSGSVLRPLTGAPLTGDLAGSYPPPLATVASLDALRAEVAALRTELARLTSEFVRQTNTHIGRIIDACPTCGKRDLCYSTTEFGYGQVAKHTVWCQCGWERNY